MPTLEFSQRPRDLQREDVAGWAHDDKWREEVLKLGGTLDDIPGLLKDYRKKETK